jgi:hypothetical protein
VSGVAETAYIPGVCNINAKEVAAQRHTGHIGLALSLIVIGALFTLHAPAEFGFVAAVPFWMVASGYIQARNRFCMGYGRAGTQIADEHITRFVQVISNQDRYKDMLRAAQLRAQAGLWAAGGGAVVAAALAVIG